MHVVHSETIPSNVERSDVAQSTKARLALHLPEDQRVQAATKVSLTLEGVHETSEEHPKLVAHVQRKMEMARESFEQSRGLQSSIEEYMRLIERATVLNDQSKEQADAVRRALG